MSQQPIQSEALGELRVQIDALDRQLLQLLNERAKVAEKVGEIKRAEGSPFFRPDRVAQVIDKITSANPGPLKGEHVASIWREIMSACLALEAPQRVAVLGPQGTFCEQAAIEFFGSAASLIYCANFDEVFHATAAGTAQYGVVGMENSTEGVVARSLDLFLRSPVHVVGEVSLLVRHNLLRQTPGDEGIEVVLAHPQALAQCQGWLSQHLPLAERRAVASNAEGARLAASAASGESSGLDRIAFHREVLGQGRVADLPIELGDDALVGVHGQRGDVGHLDLDVVAAHPPEDRPGRRRRVDRPGQGVLAPDHAGRHPLRLEPLRRASLRGLAGAQAHQEIGERCPVVVGKFEPRAPGRSAVLNPTESVADPDILPVKYTSCHLSPPAALGRHARL